MSSSSSKASSVAKSHLPSPVTSINGSSKSDQSTVGAAETPFSPTVHTSSKKNRRKSSLESIGNDDDNNSSIKSKNKGKKKTKAPAKTKTADGEKTSTTASGGCNPAFSPSIADSSASQPRPEYVAHKFVWDHGGNIVKVTGTFDNWKQTIVLLQSPDNQDHFEITVDLDRSQKILFKFVVDDQWRCTNEIPTEYDGAGNQNNVLLPIAA
ncbi:hypothetical protein BGZ51_001488 [Haplosporangium sp. Z 767]|nr:hypothetical protein BGZ50_004955 [Haplosporangium sp. Z 11]KAF9187229.1 hypothetical protein BGZ51_001488 [Haplosporangium sp. Z 767]